MIVDHARHIADRIGVEHVALGSDFDGAPIPAALGDVAGLPSLLQAFSDGGFTDEEIAAIAWDNWRRVLAAWWSGLKSAPAATPARRHAKLSIRARLAQLVEHFTCNEEV